MALEENKSYDAAIARHVVASALQNKAPIQVAMLGQRGVGKTALIHRFLFDEFPIFTEAIEDNQRQVICYNNQFLDVTIIDTSGKKSEKKSEKSETSEFFRHRHAMENAQVFLLVYSIDNKGSLKALKEVCNEIASVKGKENLPKIILVGNKGDKVETGNCPDESDDLGDIMRACSEIKPIQTSAKDNTNVTKLFDEVITVIRGAPLGFPKPLNRTKFGVKPKNGPKMPLEL